MSDTKKLHSDIKRFWTNQNKSGHVGLVMLDGLMKHWAVTNDWTPLGRFLALSGGEKSKLWAIVRVAFGPERVKSISGKKGEFGFKLQRVGWTAQEGEPFPLEKQNGYGIIREALERGKAVGFRDVTFQKSIREALGQNKPEKKDKGAIEAMEQVYKYLSKKVSEDQNLKAELSDMLTMFEKRIEARKKQVEPDH